MIAVAEGLPPYMTADYWQEYAARSRKNWSRYRRLYKSVDAWVKAHPNRAVGRLVEMPRVRFYFERTPERWVFSTLERHYAKPVRGKCREISERLYRAARGLPPKGTVPQPVWKDPWEGQPKPAVTKAMMIQLLQALRGQVPAGRVVNWMAEVATAKQLETVVGRMDAYRRQAS